MEQKKEGITLKERIRSGQICWEDVTRRLAELAFGKANDCVRLALMPRSFVEQACARCSVAGSQLWFNCNPAGPEHWFYKTWIQQRSSETACGCTFPWRIIPP